MKLINTECVADCMKNGKVKHIELSDFISYAEYTYEQKGMKLKFSVPTPNTVKAKLLISSGERDIRKIIAVATTNNGIPSPIDLDTNEPHVLSEDVLSYLRNVYASLSKEANQEKFNMVSALLSDCDKGIKYDMEEMRLL